MSKSNAYENLILDHTLGGVTYTPPANIHVALYTVSPGEDDTGTEVTGGSYARVSTTNDATNWPAAVDGSKQNGTEISFPTPTDSWGTVTHFGLRTAATGGTLLYYGALDTPQAIASGNIVRFPVGSLTITED